jgi:hypothetical protein
MTGVEIQYLELLGVSRDRLFFSTSPTGHVLTNIESQNYGGIDNQTGSDTSGEDELISRIRERDGSRGGRRYHHSSIEDELPSKPFADNDEYIPKLLVIYLSAE